MKEISLPCGSVVFVDDEDYEYLNQWKWNACPQHDKVRVQRKARVDESQPTRSVYLHIEVAKRAGLWREGLEVDHKDRDPLNNRRLNLRPATRQQNAWNQGVKRTNKTGYKGIAWHSRKKKWMARIRTEGGTRFLGYFNTPEAGAAAYNEAAARYHGEFAYLNALPAQPQSRDGKSFPEAEGEARAGEKDPGANHQSPQG